MPQHFFTISLTCQNRLNPFDSVPLATLCFKFRVIKKGRLCKICCRISNAMVYYLLEILRSHPFLVSQNFETQSCQWYGVKRTKFIFAGERNTKTRFGVPLYYLNSSHFFNKTILSSISLQSWALLRRRFDSVFRTSAYRNDVDFCYVSSCTNSLQKINAVFLETLVRLLVFQQLTLARH